MKKFAEPSMSLVVGCSIIRKQLRHNYALVFVIKQTAFGSVNALLPYSHARRSIHLPGSRITSDCMSATWFHVTAFLGSATAAESAATTGCEITFSPSSLPIVPEAIISGELASKLPTI